MKQFRNLSDKHKERAIHMAEHIVIDNLLRDGIMLPMEADDDTKERFEKITALLTEAKEIEDPAEQAEFLMDNDLTGEVIFQEAYDLADEALYIEKGEMAFDLAEIDDHYIDEEPELITGEEGNVEDQPISKKDLSQLN